MDFAKYTEQRHIEVDVVSIIKIAERFRGVILILLIGMASISQATASPFIVTPAPGSQLSGSSQNFQWDNDGTAVTDWWIDVGSAVGSSNYHNSGSLGSGASSHVVSGLPTNGSIVYVRLWYVSGSWQFTDTQYTAASGGSSGPAITSPTAGSLLSGSSQTFQWVNNGTAVTDWWIDVGSAVGSSNYHNSGSLGSGASSHVVSGLPTNGSIVYVRLWYVSGSWQFTDTQYTAASGGGNIAPNGVIDTPGGNVTINVGQSVNFAGTGSDPDNNLPLTYLWMFGAGSGAANSTAADPGQVQFNTAGVFNVSFTVTDSLGLSDATPASRTITVNGGSSGPAITSPTAGSLLSGSSQTFQWVNNGTAVTNWWIDVGSAVGGSNYHNSGSLGSGASSRLVTGLPTNGSIVYVRLWYVSGSWQFTDTQYTAASGGGGNIAPNGVIDTPGGNVTINVGQSVNFAGTGSDPDNNLPLTYLWMFGAGSGAANSTAADPGQVQFNTAGVFNVSFTVTDSLGLSDATPASRTVTVNGGSSGPAITSPTAGSLLSGSSQTFQWVNNGTAVTNWWIDVGSAVGGSNYHNSGSLGSGASSRLVTGLPTNGSIVYVRLWYVSGSWQFTDTQYTAASGSGSVIKLVGFGDSITSGVGDDISSDNQSLDGRNNHTGYTPILNNLLTAATGNAHTVEVFGLVGFDSADAVLEIDGALAAHADADNFLIQFGTNDATPVIPLPSGLGLTSGDAGYPGTYKNNMQQIVDAVEAANVIALLAKPPIRYGPCSSSSQCQSYMQSGIDPETATANVSIREYDLVVDELIVENGLRLDPGQPASPLFVAPDLYAHFLATGTDSTGKSPKFFDWLHPNGVGYQEMADLWSQSLTP